MKKSVQPKRVQRTKTSEPRPVQPTDDVRPLAIQPSDEPESRPMPVDRRAGVIQPVTCLTDRICQLRSIVRCISVQMGEGSGVLEDDVAWSLMHIADELDRVRDDVHAMQHGAVVAKAVQP